MQPASTLVSVEEYLRTSFGDGDREYVDGRIVERNLGEKDHSRTQRKLIAFFVAQEAALGTYCFPEQRVQVKRTLLRVPDVCVYVGREPHEQVFRTPPFLVVEILSRDDRTSDTQEKIEDYLDFGVSYVWIIDPRTRQGYVHTRQGSRTAAGGILGTEDPAIELALASLFD